MLIGWSWVTRSSGHQGNGVSSTRIRGLRGREGLFSQDNGGLFAEGRAPLHGLCSMKHRHALYLEGRIHHSTLPSALQRAEEGGRMWGCGRERSKRLWGGVGVGVGRWKGVLPEDWKTSQGQRGMVAKSAPFQTSVSPSVQRG